MAEQKIIDVEPRYLKIVQSIFARNLPFKKVWAFGSRVKWTARPSSDLDCVIFGATDNEIYKAGEAFDESEIPFEVQLLNWQTIPDDFKKHIEREYFVIRKESDWGEFKLSKFANEVRGSYQPKSQDDYIYIGLEHIEQQNLRFNGQGHSSEIQSTKRFFQKEDILFGSLRPYFRKVVKPKFFGVCSTDITVVRSNPDNADQGFLYYLIASKKFIDHASNIANGSRMPRASWKVLESSSWLIPQLPTQRKIAGILSAYDDLIENNNKRINILEEMAQMLYKEWFVDFKFPNHQNTKFVDSELGKIPDGWEYKELNKVIEHNIGGGWGKEEIDEKHNIPAFVIRGTDIPNVKVNQIELVPFRFHKKSNFLTRQILEDDIVFEVSGGSKGQPVGRTLLITKKIKEQFCNEIICASFCKLIRVDTTLILPELVYLHFLEIYTNGHIDKYQVQSTGITNFKFSIFLEQEKILIPDKIIQSQFNNTIKSLYKEKDYLGIKNQNLKKTRDLLLSRLISGKISVENLEVKI